MIVLDTNVISELLRDRPDDGVLGWLDRQVSDEILLTSTTVGELASGIEQLPAGRRRDRLRAALEVIVHDEFRDRIVPFDVTAAFEFGVVTAHRKEVGRPISLADAEIAAITRTIGAALATRNTHDFELLQIELIDPWDS